MKSIRSQFCLAVFLLSGCLAIPATPYVDLGPFDAAEMQQKLSPGNNTIKGSALMRQVGGGVVTCAGNVVSLAASTKYSDAWAKAHYGSSTGGFHSVYQTHVDYSDEAAFYRSLRSTHCDAQGYFKFDNLADGTYYVFTAISWQVPGQFGMQAQGGSIMRSVSLADGKTEELVLSE